MRKSWRSSLTGLGLLTLAALLAPGTRAGPPANRPGHAHLQAGADRAAWIQARRNANAAAQGLKGQKLAEAKAEGGKKVRKGSYKVGKGKGPAQVDYTVTEATGADSSTIELSDVAAGVKGSFAYADEAGTGTITVQGKSLSVGFNPDGTVSVDGKAYTSVSDAAWAAANHAVMAPATANMGAALVEIIGALAEEPGGSRGNTPSRPPGEFTAELGCDLGTTC